MAKKSKMRKSLEKFIKGAATASGATAGATARGRARSKPIKAAKAGLAGKALAKGAGERLKKKKKKKKGKR